MQIQRAGLVTFGDAAIYVSENPKRTSHAQWTEYEKGFKREVFKRIIQQMNRLGWSVMPWDEADHYATIANAHRTCTYGELRAELAIKGRCIELKMWQGVNTPNRPDHGGRYEPNKESVMPYLIRLRMERTRRKLRDYLCAVFSDYTFLDYSPKAKSVGPGGMTATAFINKRIKDSGHYKDHLGHAEIHGNNDVSADGCKLEHGKGIVYAFDRKGRAISGTPYFDLNGNWIIHSGKHAYSWHWHTTIYVNKPENLKQKRNGELRRQRLESELSKAIKAMDFMRAQTLKEILFPQPVQLYLVRDKEGFYHRPNFRGYTQDATEAGKFTEEEAKGYARDNQLIAL